MFDVAASLLLVDFEKGHETRREERPLLTTEPSSRISELLSCQADVLICGAISAQFEDGLTAAGVPVISFVCGEIGEVLAAYLNGELPSRVFAMPGCQRWRRREGENVMPRRTTNLCIWQRAVAGEGPSSPAIMDAHASAISRGQELETLNRQIESLQIVLVRLRKKIEELGPGNEQE